MNRKKLTRIQAWRFIQKKFIESVGNNEWRDGRYTVCGLCFAIRTMWKSRKITSGSVTEMQRDLSRLGKGWPSYYFWDTNCKKGGLARIKAIDRILRRKKGKPCKTRKPRG